MFCIVELRVELSMTEMITYLSHAEGELMAELIWNVEGGTHGRVELDMLKVELMVMLVKLVMKDQVGVELVLNGQAC
ncbi:hypothetical protein L195_g035209 [Trifolium pratense]|uniref:Uncharacterized protein n=1 Tax=Trifolium pratense TaxID=57577 RepID=A0A2K3LL05_TRIPR|nr:hypothetical protein L195_g035209 [Trifolium pratense]